MPCGVQHQLHKHSTQEGVCAPQAESRDGMDFLCVQGRSCQWSEVLPATNNTGVPVLATVCGLSVSSHLVLPKSLCCSEHCELEGKAGHCSGAAHTLQGE